MKLKMRSHLTFEVSNAKEREEINISGKSPIGLLLGYKVETSFNSAKQKHCVR